MHDPFIDGPGESRHEGPTHHPGSEPDEEPSRSRLPQYDEGGLSDVAVNVRPKLHLRLDDVGRVSHEAGQESGAKAATEVGRRFKFFGEDNPLLELCVEHEIKA